MSTTTESSSVNCVLCGQAIAPGEPSYAIILGTFEDDNTFNEVEPVAFACGCLLRAAERRADHKPVFADEFANAEEYVEHIKCMNAATEPDKEQRYVKCPKCYCGKWVDIDYEGPLSCEACGWIYFTQPLQKED